MTNKEIVGIFKRFIIVFLLCSPIIIVLSLLTSLGVWVIIISVIIIGAIFGLEEYIRYKNLKKKQERRKRRSE